MERRHEDALKNALEALMLNGAVTLRWAQLYLWFGAERLGKSSYREIQRTWEELCDVGNRKAPALRILTKEKGQLYEFTLMRDKFEGEVLVELNDWC